MSRLFPVGYQFTDSTGAIVANGEVFVYDNNTTDLSTVYTDAALSTAAQNPMPLTAAGRLTSDIFTTSEHSIRVENSANAAVVTADDVQGGEKWTVVTFADGDTTPSVSGALFAKTANSTGTTITTFDGGRIGQTVVVLINDANTTLDVSSTTLKGLSAVDRTPQSGDALRCTYDGTNWYCVLIRASDPAGSAADADATPSVAGLSILTTANTGATTITALDDGYKGQRVTVVIGDANTTIDFTGTTLKGNAGVDWTPGNGDHMDCVFNGTNWYCVISDNTA